MGSRHSGDNVIGTYQLRIRKERPGLAYGGDWRNRDQSAPAT